MPELPEVEIYRRYFALHALNQPIRRVVIHDPRILGETTPAKLRRALTGASFHEVRRHGKHLFAAAGDRWLHLHFGMSGDLAWYRDPADEPRFSRLVFDFHSGGHLSYDDMRLFGVIDLAPSPEEFILAHRLGPDALDPRDSAARFRARLRDRRGAIKPLLMSQELVAGVGNLYADEAFFQTGIDPRRPAASLSDAEARALFLSLRSIMKKIIERKLAGRGYPASFLIPNREAGVPCPRCGAELAHSVVGGRTTWYCPAHQR